MIPLLVLSFALAAGPGEDAGAVPAPAPSASAQGGAGGSASPGEAPSAEGGEGQPAGQAGQGQGGQGQAGQGHGGGHGGGNGGEKGGRMGSGRSHRSQGSAAPEAASNDLWYLAAVAGALFLVGVGYFWFRAPRRAAPLPDGVRRIAEQGLFGPRTPTLGEGVTQWVVADPDRSALLAHLVTAVAERRPVLVHAADSVELPATRGLPAFRAAYSKAPELQDAAFDLQEEHPTLAVVLDAQPATLVEWTRDLAKELPVLAVVPAAVADAGTVVRCARNGAEWRFEVG